MKKSEAILLAMRALHYAHDGEIATCKCDEAQAYHLLSKWVSVKKHNEHRNRWTTERRNAQKSTG